MDNTATSIPCGCQNCIEGRPHDPPMVTLSGADKCPHGVSLAGRCDECVAEYMTKTAIDDYIVPRRIPPRVYIGPVAYKVTIVAEAIGEDCDCGGTHAFVGSLDTGSLEIEIAEGLARPRKRVVLWHEILHGLLHDLGYSCTAETEQLVSGLASALVDLFIQNPDIVSAFTED